MARLWGGRLARAWLAVAGAALADLACAQPSVSGLQVVEQARFLAGLGAASGEAVSLPHDWRASPWPRLGEGRYVLSVALPAEQVGQPWAIWSSRFPLHHRVRVNGQLLADTWAVPNGTSPRTTPIALALPPGWLRAGSNQIEIEERGGLRAGLGPVLVGPTEPVQAAANQWRRWTVELPRLLNGAAVGTALFSLMLWLRRRQEGLTGLFGGVALLLCLRNFVYFEPGLALGAGGGLLMFAVTGVASLLYAHFAWVVSGRDSPRRRWVTGGIALVCTVLAAWAWRDPEAMNRVRLLAYPLLIPSALLATAELFRHAAGRSRRGLWALAATGAVLLASGVHDYLLQMGQLPHTHEYAFVWTAPLLALSYGLLLGGRLVRALHEAERGRQLLEQRVAERTASLAKANAAKARFLAAASHDLRQPLVSMGVLLGLLREQAKAPGTQRLVDGVDESARVLQAMLDSLLDLSRLDASSPRLDPQAVDLEVLLAGLQRQDLPQALRKGLQLRLRVPPGATVWADPVLLQQVLRNLLSNALRYTAQGGVLLSARRRGNTWCLQVWDTGVGIPPEQQGRVFDEFVQGEAGRRQREQGLGLGLAIVQRAARLLGSEVQLRSVVERGSCFSLALPAVRGPGRPLDSPAA